MSHPRQGSSVRPRRVVTAPTELSGALGSPRVRRMISASLVLGQVALVLLVLIPAGPVLWTGREGLGWALVVIGALVGALGLLGLGRDTRVTPVPASGGRLHRNGIYAFVRHPMYLGLTLLCLGATLISGRLLALFSLVLLIGLLTAKARVEDLILQRKFGWEFAVYSVRVPAIVPQPWRSHRR